METENNYQDLESFSGKFIEKNATQIETYLNNSMVSTDLLKKLFVHIQNRKDLSAAEKNYLLQHKSFVEIFGKTDSNTLNLINKRNIQLGEDLEKLKSDLIPMNTYDEREKLYKQYVSDIRQLTIDGLTIK